MELRDFELTPLNSAPERYVSSLFGSNDDYLVLKPVVPAVESYAGQFEVEAMVSMLTDPDISSADDRRLALELQLMDPIPFDRSVVKGLIVPRSLLSAPYFKNFISHTGTGIDVVTYDSAPLRLARDYLVLLEQHARELQQKWGIL